MTTPNPSSTNPSNNPSNPSGQTSKTPGTNPSQSNVGSSRQDPNQANQGSRQAAGAGNQENASRSFARSEQESGQEGRGNKQDIERYLNAIESNCRDLRQALGGRDANDQSRGDSDESRTSSGRESGRESGRDSGRDTGRSQTSR